MAVERTSTACSASFGPIARAASRPVAPSGSSRFRAVGEHHVHGAKDTSGQRSLLTPWPVRAIASRTSTWAISPRTTSSTTSPAGLMQSDGTCAASRSSPCARSPSSIRSASSGTTARTSGARSIEALDRLTQVRRRLQPVALAQPLERGVERLLVGDLGRDPAVAAHVPRDADEREQLGDLALLRASA